MYLTPLVEPNWKSFDYVRWNIDHARIECRPHLPVVVHGPGGYVPLSGLVDSGAEDCMISSELAEPLGVNLRKAIRTQVSGVGGEGREGRITKVEIEVPDFQFRFEAPIIFSDIPFPLILGQNNFFLHFRVLFERDQAVFKLAKIPKLI